MSALDAEPSTDPRLKAYREDTFARMNETDRRLAQGARVLRTIKAAIAALVAVSGLAMWIFTRTESHLEQHVQDSAQAHRQMSADTHEVQMDVRALYRTVLTKERQPRLEAAPDGGQ